MLAVSLVFGSFLTFLFLVVGIIGGLVAREYLMNYQDVPRLHPEFFDEHGNVVPDEVLALRFEEGFFTDESEEEEDWSLIKFFIKWSIEFFRKLKSWSWRTLPFLFTKLSAYQLNAIITSLIFGELIIEL